MGDGSLGHLINPGNIVATLEHNAACAELRILAVYHKRPVCPPIVAHVDGAEHAAVGRGNAVESPAVLRVRRGVIHKTRLLKQSLGKVGCRRTLGKLKRGLAGPNLGLVLGIDASHRTGNRDGCRNVLLDPLGVDRDVGRNSRIKVERLRSVRIGKPAIEGIAFALGVGRPYGLVPLVDRLIRNDRALARIKTNGEGLDGRGLLAANGKQIARIVDVVERAVRADRGRTHAVVLISRSGSVDLLGNSIPNLVAIERSRVIVAREVHVGSITLLGDDRGGLNLARNVTGCRLRDRRDNRHAIGIDNRQLTVVGTVRSRSISAHAADVDSVTGEDRRRGGAERLGTLAIFAAIGNRDFALLRQDASGADTELVQIAIIADDIDNLAAGCDRDPRPHGGAKAQARDRLARGEIDGLHGAVHVADKAVVSRHAHTGPVVIGLGADSLLLPDSLAGRQVKADGVAARAGPAGARLEIDFTGRYRKVTLALLRAAFAIGQLLTNPNGRKGICRQRLHASVTQRNKYQAVRIGHARYRRDGAHELGTLNDVTSLSITLIERITSHDKEVVAGGNRFGDIRGPVGRLLKLGDPFFLGSARRGRGLGSTRSGRRPRAAPIRTLGTRVDDNAIDLSRRLLKVIEID